MVVSSQAASGEHSPRNRGGVTSGPAPAICLQALHPQDPLRHKWQLGPGLPPATEQHWQQHEAEQSSPPRRNGQLRLSSRHESGHLWECLVPFSELAREGGMVLGQCPQTADIVLPHAGVSHRHALLEIAESGLVVTSLCPERSTCVNEQELSPYDRRFPLSHGADLHLGDASLRLEYLY